MVINDEGEFYWIASHITMELLYVSCYEVQVKVHDLLNSPSNPCRPSAVGQREIKMSLQDGCVNILLTRKKTERKIQVSSYNFDIMF